MSGALLRVDKLSKYYWCDHRSVAAVEDVSFEIQAGEIFALCGLSGSGKSTVAHLVMRLLPPDAGSIFFDGRDLARVPDEELRTIRHQFQMVFQNVTGSFNPRTTVRRALDDPLRIARRLGREEREIVIDELLSCVELPKSIMNRAIHEVSGGQRQRIAIARALATNPALVVLDEALSGIDSSIRGDLLRLLLDLRAERNLTYLFISHDLAVIRAIADRVAIMHEGRIVETGQAIEVIDAPASDIGKALVAATPRFATPITTAT